MALLCPWRARLTRGSAGAEQTQDVYIPLKLPLDSARHAPGTERGYSYVEIMPNDNWC
jgi:hypothetical protein